MDTLPLRFQIANQSHPALQSPTRSHAHRYYPHLIPAHPLFLRSFTPVRPMSDGETPLTRQRTRAQHLPRVLGSVNPHRVSLCVAWEGTPPGRTGQRSGRLNGGASRPQLSDWDLPRAGSGGWLLLAEREGHALGRSFDRATVLGSLRIRDSRKSTRTGSAFVESNSEARPGPAGPNGVGLRRDGPRARPEFAAQLEYPDVAGYAVTVRAPQGLRSRNCPYLRTGTRVIGR